METYLNIFEFEEFSKIKKMKIIYHEKKKK